jgi:hypothetical protein
MTLNLSDVIKNLKFLDDGTLINDWLLDIIHRLTFSRTSAVTLHTTIGAKFDACGAEMFISAPADAFYFVL